MIYCLMRNGAFLSADVCDHLYRSARQLVKKAQRELRVKTESYEGVISTDGEFTSMGFLSGMVFMAEIDHDSESTTIHYIVTTSDLPSADECNWYRQNEEGSWSEIDDIVWN